VVRIVAPSGNQARIPLNSVRPARSDKDGVIEIHRQRRLRWARGEHSTSAIPSDLVGIPFRSNALLGVARPERAFVFLFRTGVMLRLLLLYTSVHRVQT